MPLNDFRVYTKEIEVKNDFKPFLTVKGAREVAMNEDKEEKKDRPTLEVLQLFLKYAELCKIPTKTKFD